MKWNLRKSKKGFTLIEVMIVAGIISSLSVASIPAYQAVKINANESLAQENLRGLAAAFEEYMAFSGTVAYPAALNQVSGYVNPDLAAGQRNGYTYQIDTQAGEAFAILAQPVDAGVTGNRVFRIKQGGGVEELTQASQTLQDFKRVGWNNFRVQIVGSETTSTSFTLKWKFTNILRKTMENVIMLVNNIRFGGAAQGAKVMYDGLIKESTRAGAADHGYYNLGTLKSGESAIVQEKFTKDSGGLNQGGWWYSRSFQHYEEKP